MRRAIPSFATVAVTVVGGLVGLVGLVGLGSPLAACSGTGSEGVNSSGGTSGTSGTSSGTSGTSSGTSGTSGDDASTSGGTDSGTTPADGAADGAAQPFKLTSTALAEGGKFATENTCTGLNDSPPFSWTAGPAGTLSYALVLTDQSNSLVHAVIYDIPGTATSLPAAVQNTYQPASVPGAKQTTAYDNATRGYLGPCPGSVHTYEFALYAIDVATLPGATMATTRAQIVPLIMAHDLAVARLTGTYVKP